VTQIQPQLWVDRANEAVAFYGEALCIRRGAVHHFDNHGEADAKALCVITPGALGPDYFREVAAVFAESAGDQAP
jgi:quercetin dioxygenase-like cupin family protein